MSANLKNQNLQSFLVCGVSAESGPLVKVLNALSLEELVKSDAFIDFIHDTYDYSKGCFEEDSTKLSDFIKIFDSSLQEVDISHIRVYIGVVIHV